MTTFFCPRKSDSFTVPPRCVRSSKSGASSPAFSAIDPTSSQGLDCRHARDLPRAGYVLQRERELARVSRFLAGRYAAENEACGQADVRRPGILRHGDGDVVEIQAECSSSRLEPERHP